jgi:hypothetical protein
MDIDQSSAHYDDPRCTGPWPEDYWLFESDAAVKANTEAHQFGAGLLPQVTSIGFSNI